MNNITIFNFNQNQVRTQTINGEPWFCLVDACAALEIKRSKDSVRQLSSKGAVKNRILTNGGYQETYFINEPNLYRLIFRSNKPQAQAFADWVYSEVLPSIRKTGGYGSLDVQTLAKAVAAELQKPISDTKLLPSAKVEYPEWMFDFVNQHIKRTDEVTSRAEVYQMFDLFCFTNGHATPSANRLGRFLHYLGFKDTATRRGEKAYYLSLKAYDNTVYRYHYRRCKGYEGAGVYRCQNGESYRVIESLDAKEPTLYYAWFNPRINQAESFSRPSPKAAFESTITDKLVGVYTEVAE